VTTKSADGPEFPVVGLLHFLLGRWQTSSCVELVRFTFLLRVGLAHRFVGVGLSELPVGLSQFVFFVWAVVTSGMLC
jgi:hypothetical protein